MPQGGQHWLQITDGDGLAAATHAPVLARRYLHGPATDQMLAADDGQDVLWGLADHQGSVRDVCVGGTSIGTLASHRTYDAFGQLVPGSAAVDFIFGYAGRPLDPDTGLYNNRARWYDPATGRFPNEDPLGLAAGDANLYRYAGNSPVIYVDPSGLCYTGAGSIASALGRSVWGGVSSTLHDLWSQAKPVVQFAADYAVLSAWNAKLSYEAWAEGPLPEVSTMPRVVAASPPAEEGESWVWPWDASASWNVLDTAEVWGGGVKSAAIRGDQFAGQINAAAWGQGWVDPETTSGVRVTWETTKGVGQGAGNVVVGTGKGVREMGYMAADFSNASLEATTGYTMYRGDLSQGQQALTSGQVGYGQYYGEFGANTVTLGTYNQGKALYQLGTGQITVDQASEQIGGTAVLQWAGAKLLSTRPVRSNAPATFAEQMTPAEATRYQQYWQRYAPQQVKPGTGRLDFLRQSGRTGRMESSRVIYDEFGRQRYRVDFSNHMRPGVHSNPHLHEYQYGPGFSNTGREGVYNFGQ